MGLLTLEKAGFTEYKASNLKRMIMSVQSKEKEGKTHFSFTAPGPIAYISIDIGEEGVIEKFQQDKKIYWRRLPSVFTADNKSKAKAVWTEFESAFRAGIGAAKTVIVDTATEAWEILRMAEFGQLSKVMPHHYGPVNFKYRGLIREVYEAPGVNLILIHKEKPLWINNERSDRFERSGQSDTGFDVQVNVQCYRRMDPGDPDEGISPHPVFGINILDCRLDASLIGTQWEGEMADFSSLLDIIYG